MPKDLEIELVWWGKDLAPGRLDHLESGEILSRWSVPVPLRWFLRSHDDVAEQRACANKMARRAGGADDKLNTLEDWEWLLEDMLKLRGTGENGIRGAFGLLSEDEIFRIFFAGLLSTGCQSVSLFLTLIAQFITSVRCCQKLAASFKGPTAISLKYRGALLVV